MTPIAFFGGCPGPRIKQNPMLLLRFGLRVLGDIVTANFEVAYLIANPWRKLKPHFIEYP
ncbi:hypothetical protein DK37_21875 [Halomonas sp. SUBG004]|nr:hypothetical protein DK37_21875 [Halomonas sp. SUBG004]